VCFFIIFPPVKVFQAIYIVKVFFMGISVIKEFSPTILTLEVLNLPRINNIIMMVKKIIIKTFLTNSALQKNFINFPLIICIIPGAYL